MSSSSNIRQFFCGRLSRFNYFSCLRWGRHRLRGSRQRLGRLALFILLLFGVWQSWFIACRPRSSSALTCFLFGLRRSLKAKADQVIYCFIGWRINQSLFNAFKRVGLKDIKERVSDFNEGLVLHHLCGRFSGREASVCKLLQDLTQELVLSAILL